MSVSGMTYLFTRNITSVHLSIINGVSICSTDIHLEPSLVRKTIHLKVATKPTKSSFWENRSIFRNELKNYPNIYHDDTKWYPISLPESWSALVLDGWLYEIILYQGWDNRLSLVKQTFPYLHLKCCLIGLDIFSFCIQHITQSMGMKSKTINSKIELIVHTVAVRRNYRLQNQLET